MFPLAQLKIQKKFFIFVCLKKTLASRHELISFKGLLIPLPICQNIESDGREENGKEFVKNSYHNVLKFVY